MEQFITGLWAEHGAKIVVGVLGLVAYLASVAWPLAVDFVKTHIKNEKLLRLFSAALPIIENAVRVAYETLTREAKAAASDGKVGERGPEIKAKVLAAVWNALTPEIRKIAEKFRVEFDAWLSSVVENVYHDLKDRAVGE